MKTITLHDPEFEGTYTVERRADGSLVLSPQLGPTIEEIEREHGERVGKEEFGRRWSHLPRDGEG